VTRHRASRQPGLVYIRPHDPHERRSCATAADPKSIYANRRVSATAVTTAAVINRHHSTANTNIVCAPPAAR